VWSGVLHKGRSYEGVDGSYWVFEKVVVIRVGPCRLSKQGDKRWMDKNEDGRKASN
jgi:hypothetical protein